VPTSKESIANELRAEPRFAHVLEAITEADDPDEPVYVVGGAVRDALLGHPSYDLDLVVEGDVPAFARRLARRLDGEVQTHKAFGTAEVLYEGGEIDVATARTETYPRPAALPEVEFATLEEDLARRDFTVNAIAASLCADDFGRLIDPHHGRADLASGTIRVLHPGSFLDDPTRIFRAIRYENRLGFRMDPETERLARAGKAGVAQLSNERFREEIVALLSEDGIAHTLERLGEFAGTSADTGLVERVDALRDELDPGAPLWRLRLAVIARGHPGLLDRLALRREDQRAVEQAIALAPRLAGATDPVEITGLAGRSPEAALLALAEHDSRELREWFTRLRNVRLDISGADLAELGLPESPRVGEVLEELRRRKLRGELDGRESELAAARELIVESCRGEAS
jgi:tRNA nucleotidyltransferase (CCA-adding enzyme)